jgi:hypothetical protein
MISSGESYKTAGSLEVRRAPFVDHLILEIEAA